LAAVFNDQGGHPQIGMRLARGFLCRDHPRWSVGAEVKFG
jgi:hypothetical protein